MAVKNKREKAMTSGLPLPDELVLSSIIPLLSMKDVARSSLASHTWLRYWRNTPILSFHDPDLDTMVLNAVEDLSTYYHVVSDATIRFITWVSNVLSNHIGCRVEEFRVAYYLNNAHKVDIDRWVVWAFSKHVQTLDLDFTPPRGKYGGFGEENYYYVLDKTLFGHPFKLCLTTLRLNTVNVDSPSLHSLLRACSSTLQDLCIVKSHYLTSIADLELPSLKYFMLTYCPNLERIDIKAPKLVSLTYRSNWHAILKVFNIRNASELCYADLYVKFEEGLLFVLSSLFKYFSQLEVLKLQWRANHTMNPVLDKFPLLSSLKHLELSAGSFGDRTLAAWVPFIGACPHLEKFTLEICGWLTAVPRTKVYGAKYPLRCLKTFEIKRFYGPNLDVDVANFVVENAINLREVILHPRDLFRPLDLEVPFADVDFELPPHVKLVIVK